jgi:hypothetical protein
MVFYVSLKFQPHKQRQRGSESAGKREKRKQTFFGFSRTLKNLTKNRFERKKTRKSIFNRILSSDMMSHQRQKLFDGKLKAIYRFLHPNEIIITLKMYYTNWKFEQHKSYDDSPLAMYNLLDFNVIII